MSPAVVLDPPILITILFMKILEKLLKSKVNSVHLFISEAPTEAVTSKLLPQSGEFSR